MVGCKPDSRQWKEHPSKAREQPLSKRQDVGRSGTDRKGKRVREP